MTGLFEILIALVVATLLGFGVPKLMTFTTKSIRLVPPNGITQEQWEEIVCVGSGGAWISFFERILIIGALHLNSPSIIIGWLAFKVAAKWEAWNNIVKVPDKLNNTSDPCSYLRARNAWGTWILQRFLMGTILNIVIGFLAYYIGQNSI
jgi:hypothetical protein